MVTSKKNFLRSMPLMGATDPTGMVNSPCGLNDKCKPPRPDLYRAIT